MVGRRPKIRLVHYCLGNQRCLVRLVTKASNSIIRYNLRTALSSLGVGVSAVIALAAAWIARAVSTYLEMFMIKSGSFLYFTSVFCK